MLKITQSTSSPLTILLLCSLLSISACSEQNSPDGNTTQTSENPPQSIAQTQPAIPASTQLPTPSANNGKVISVQHAGGYSYIEADIQGSTFWIAASISSVKAGDEIKWNDYAMMKGFTSKAINRTFDQIMFIDRVALASGTDSSPSMHAGKVLEVMDSAGYSYIRVEDQGQSIWLAAPSTKLTTGQSISWSSGSPMRNFSSKSLDRTFDIIYFVGSVQVDQG